MLEFQCRVNKEVCQKSLNQFAVQGFCTKLDVYHKFNGNNEECFFFFYISNDDNFEALN
jgi:hypothetical protein